MQRSSANALAYSLIVDQQMWVIIRNNIQPGFINNILTIKNMFYHINLMMNYYLLIISQTARERAKLAEHLSSLESDTVLCLENRKEKTVRPYL